MTPSPERPAPRGGELGDGLDALSLKTDFGRDPFASQYRLWEFLEGHVRRYTMGESTSVPLETAEALTKSVLYTLGLDPEDPAAPERLPEEELREAYGRGVRKLRRKTALGRALWQSVCRAAPPFASRALAETLESIGGFFGRYDVLWFARDIPCDIDYPLCRPVPETLYGIDYVNEYLTYLAAELSFLNRFAPARCESVLSAVQPDYRELVVNLFEPVADCAVGLALAGGTPGALELTPTQDRALQKQLSELPPDRLRRELNRAAERVCAALGVGAPSERRCLFRAAEDLAPRIAATLERGGLEGLFPCRRS